MLGGARLAFAGWGTFTGAPSCIILWPALNACPFRIFERQFEFACQGIDCRPRALPHALALEPHVAYATAPRRHDAADCPVVAAIGVLLVETPDDIGSDANECAPRSRRLDAVLAPVPGEHKA